MNWEKGGLVLYFGEHAVQISAPTIAIFVLAFLLALGFLNAFVARKRRPCKWKRARDDNRPPFTAWRCRSCAMVGYTTDDLPPKECKRPLKPAL